MSYSILCDHCEEILEYTTQYGVIMFLKNHPNQCKGPTTND